MASTMINTPPLYVDRLSERDILLGRGTGPNEHGGNQMFRNLVRFRRSEYVQARTSEEQGIVFESTIALVHSSGGRFLKKVGSLQNKKNPTVPRSRWTLPDGGGPHRRAPAPPPRAIYEIVTDMKVLIYKTKQAFRYSKDTPNSNTDDGMSRNNGAKVIDDDAYTSTNPISSPPLLVLPPNSASSSYKMAPVGPPLAETRRTHHGAQQTSASPSAAAMVGFLSLLQLQQQTTMPVLPDQKRSSEGFPPYASRSSSSSRPPPTHSITAAQAQLLPRTGWPLQLDVVARRRAMRDVECIENLAYAAADTSRHHAAASSTAAAQKTSSTTLAPETWDPSGGELLPAVVSLLLRGTAMSDSSSRQQESIASHLLVPSSESRPRVSPKVSLAGLPRQQQVAEQLNDAVGALLRLPSLPPSSSASSSCKMPPVGPPLAETRRTPGGSAHAQHNGAIPDTAVMACLLSLLQQITMPLPDHRENGRFPPTGTTSNSSSPPTHSITAAQAQPLPHTGQPLQYYEEGQTTEDDEDTHSTPPLMSPIILDCTLGKNIHHQRAATTTSAPTVPQRKRSRRVLEDDLSFVRQFLAGAVQKKRRAS
jgi:hypothetical protein